VIWLFTSRILEPALTAMLPPLLPGAEVLMKLLPFNRMELSAFSRIAPARPLENGDAQRMDAVVSRATSRA